MRGKEYLILLVLVFFACRHSGNEPKDYTQWNHLGSVKVKKAADIAGSDLWIGGEVLDRDLCSYDAYKTYLGELGAKKIRLQSGWAKTEKEKGVYDFAWLDHIVDDALSRGVQPWIQISYGNPIYPGGGGVSLGQGLITSDEALAAFARYARALVARYKDRVNEWEIWNEADLRHNSDLGHDEQTYARLFVSTAEAVRSEHPEARIVALAIAGVGNTQFVEGFFNYLQERGKVGLVDVVTFHGYPRIPDNGFKQVKMLVETVNKYDKGIEFWQGETGCPSTFGSTGALSNYPWTETSQAKWNLRRALAHIGRGYPFSLFLLSEFVYNDPLRKGLNSKGILKINEDDFSIIRPKPAYYAYQHLTAVFTHELTLQREFDFETAGRSDVEGFAWETKGMPVVALWEKDSIPSDNNHKEPVDLSMGKDGFNDPIYVDVMTGEVFEIPAQNWACEAGRCRFTGVPIYDTPVLIADRSAVLVNEKDKK